MSGALAGAAGALLAIVVFRNWADGTLGDWAKAKFLNQTSGSTPQASGVNVLTKGVGGTGGLTPASPGGLGVAAGPIGTGPLTGVQVARLAASVGLSGAGLVNAVAVAKAESGWRTDAHSATNDYGVWQINAPSHPTWTPAQLLNPYTNAQAMASISGMGTNWGPWATWPTAAGRHLDEAQQVVAAMMKGQAA